MIKKSIFIEKQVKGIYYIGRRNYYDNNLNIYLKETDETEEEYKYECNLGMPLLNKNDLFYIEEDDKTVVISQAIRTSKDGVLYICKNNIIEDKEQYNLIKIEMDKEIENRKNVEIIKQENEVTGIRKFIKKLFKL